MVLKKKEDRPLINRANEALGQRFVAGLLEWNKDENRRRMPWKGEKDPYKIWLSEVILQQTRVDQGLKYYENFIRTFPRVQDLASAPEEKVFKLWEGLGYYTRCRNLINSAKFISHELKGEFPASYESLLGLKGVGNYTAAAIASFAYNLPHAVLDGNVFRVLSRVFNMRTPVDSSFGKKQFSEIAQNILPEKKAGEYNQAIMDFGAMVCKPVPECHACFFQQDCKAYLSGKQDLLPVKEKKLRIRERWLAYCIPVFKDQVAIRQRLAKDIWAQLFEFPLIETDSLYGEEKLLELFQKQYGITADIPVRASQKRQRLTHQLIHFSFLKLKLSRKEKIRGFSWVKISELDGYAFPKSLQAFILSELR
jgi:A/G-specific adenine glycosylase